jgi:hypothetical protein
LETVYRAQKGHLIGCLTRQKAEAKLSAKNPLREKDFSDMSAQAGLPMTSLAYR